MKVEVLAVGTELLLGQIVNGNAAVSPDKRQAVLAAEEEAVRRAALDLAGKIAARLLEEW